VHTVRTGPVLGLTTELALRSDSFARHVWWLWRHRPGQITVSAMRPERNGAREQVGSRLQTNATERRATTRTVRAG
jgi:hypothetical protein